MVRWHALLWPLTLLFVPQQLGASSSNAPSGIVTGYSGPVVTAEVAEPAPQAVYRAERSGDFAYTISGPVSGGHDGAVPGAATFTDVTLAAVSCPATRTPTTSATATVGGDTATPGDSPTATESPTPSATATATETSTATDTATSTATAGDTATAGESPTPGATATATEIPTATGTATPSPTLDPCGTATPGPSGTVTLHLGYSYDAADRRTGMTYPDGRAASWGYDAAGRLSQVTEPGGGSFAVSYDPAGNLTGVAAPNGGTQSYTYDAAGRATGAAWADAGGATLFAQTATLDAAGQRVALADTWGAISYGYDGAGRLVSASYPDGTSETYTYDPAGNRVGATRTDAGGVTTSTTAGFDAADQLLTSSAVTGSAAPVVTSYGYDGNGNQTSSTGPAGAITNTFNAQDQLVRQRGPGTDLSLVYDGQGDRLRSVEAGGPLPVRRDEARDLVGGLSSLAGDGQADYAYLAPGSGMAPLSRYDRQAARGTYLGTDLLGSVRLATDPTGTAIGAGAYDAWGNARAYAGPDGATQLAGLRAAVPFGYAGQQYDQGPGTYAMRARTYDPATGRFQSVDPLLDQTGQPYQYAGDSPTGSTDPSGQARDIGTAGYVMGVDVFDGSTKSHYLQGQFRQAITRAFVQSDGTGGSFWNARASQQPYGDLTNSDVPHADLISFAPWHDLEGRAVAEIYNIVPDYYANNESNGLWMPGINDQGNPFADVSNFYPNDVQALKSLQRYAAAGGQVYYQGPPRTRDACVRRAPSLLIGRSYPAPLGVALAAPSGPQFAPVTPYAGPYRGWGGDASGQYAHYLVANVAGTAYHLFPRLLGSGLVGYSVCQPGSPESTLDWGPLHLNQYRYQCENPGPHGHQDACAFGGLAQAPLCALDLFLGGVGSAYARCGQNDAGCHAAVVAPILIGVVINAALTFGPGVMVRALGERLTVSAASGIRTLGDIQSLADREGSGTVLVRMNVDGKPVLADLQQLKRAIDRGGIAACTTQGECFAALDSQITERGILD